MQNVYTITEHLTIYLTDGSKIERKRSKATRDSRGYNRVKYFYFDELPKDNFTYIDGDDVFKKLSAEISGLIKGRLFGKKHYIDFSYLYGDLPEIEEDQVKYFTIQREYNFANKPAFSDIQQDLTFDEFTELMFLREEELDNKYYGWLGGVCEDED